jgi:SAM-dependent methyltransferase
MPGDDRPFELKPETYDALIDWPRRLANEEPFYRRVFAEVGVQSVLDVACGTGRHAAMFHAWGLRAQGADAEPAMIEYCRRAHGESDRLQWVVRSFDQPATSGERDRLQSASASFDQPAPSGDFDAVVCVGNSLALAGDMPAVRRAAAAMLASLRTGGVCIVQVLNLWALPEGPVQWQKCKALPAATGARVLLKGVHRVGDRGHVSFVDLRLAGGELTWTSHAATFCGLRAADLQDATAIAGGCDAQCYGSVRGEDYDAARSGDLILVCRRGVNPAVGAAQSP